MVNPFLSLESRIDGPALICRDREISRATLIEQARRLAAEIGSERQLVFLEAANTVEAVTAYVACLFGGHPVFLYGPQDSAKVVALAERYSPNVVFDTSKDGFTMRRESAERRQFHPELCVLLSTSGSTGSPKLVKLSSTAVYSNAAAIAEYLQLESDERAITSLKFNYSYGMSVVNSHLLCGGALILTEESVLDDEFWYLFQHHRATSLAGVPYTFETMHRSGELRFNTPHLRYMTQAGGRLGVDLVRHFANLGGGRWRFYVMYGQTEAAPRMAYLPPAHAADYPDCIGVPIPGGRMFLLDDKLEEIKQPGVPGELAYSGPNVMLGYANDVADLATDQTPPYLLTGDIGCRNEIGLYYISGRRSRFVKPFGIRISLDEVENSLRRQIPEAACAASQERIVVAVPETAQVDASSLAARMASQYGLPPSAFIVLQVSVVPRLPTGKVDYAALAAMVANQEPREPPERAWEQLKDAVSIVGSPQFRSQLWQELGHLLGLGAGTGTSVAGIYASLLQGRDVGLDSTFTSLAGDSLTYVQASLALEEYLGTLPSDWERMTVGELEQLRAVS